MASEPRSKAPAVSRAAAILRALGDADAPLGVNQLARDLELVPSTCLHILRALTDEGLVSFDPETKRYDIGVGILPIARGAIRRNGFASLAGPRLTDLSKEFGVTAVATELIELRHMVVTAVAEARLPFRLSVALGSRFPALISATGRLVAAYGDFDVDTLKAAFARMIWDNPPTFETWRAEVEAARRDGYAIDRGAYIAGVTIVAAPAFDRNGEVVRSLVAIGLSEAITADRENELAAALLLTRDEIAASLDA